MVALSVSCIFKEDLDRCGRSSWRLHFELEALALGVDVVHPRGLDARLYVVELERLVIHGVLGQIVDGGARLLHHQRQV